MTTIDGQALSSRLRTLYDKFESNKTTLFKDADAITVLVGNEEETTYRKSFSLQLWLFGYEFPETLLVFCKDAVIVLGSAKKVSLLKTATSTHAPHVPFTFHTLPGKDSKDPINASFSEIFDAIKSSSNGAIVGNLPKEKHTGALAQAWDAAYKAAGFTEVDVSAGLSDALSVKDSTELVYERKAAECSVALLKNYLTDEIEKVIDKGKAVTHESLATRTSQAASDPAKFKAPAGVQKDQLDVCYEPIVQSGGKYDLRASAQSNKDNLHFGTIIVSLGLSYRSYCANIARTIFVDPDKAQEANYAFLLELQAAVMKVMKPGTPISEAYNIAVAFIQDKRPDLASKFVKSLGSVTGLEFRDSTMVLNDKATTLFQAGQVVNLSIGFQDIDRPDAMDQQSTKYSLLLADTVAITTAEPDLLTKYSRKFTDFSYYFKDEEEEDNDVINDGPQVDLTGSRKLRTTTKTAKVDDSAQRRREHQKELALRQTEEARKRLLEGGAGDSRGSKQQEIIAYNSVSQIPSDARPHRIFIDDRRDAVLLPVHGVLTPFHIATIKNVSISKAEDSPYTYLRINFLPPPDGSTTAYLREITFRAADANNLTKSNRLILELKKRYTSRLAEAKAVSEIVPQEKLQLSKTRRIRLQEVFIRPNLGRTRSQGFLEAHTNGFRFQTAKSEVIDIMYANIKHAFFQPPESELVVLLHFRLKMPVMLGKKSCIDIQFYMEVGEATTALTGAHRGGFDDGLDEEDQERRRRKELKRRYEAFCNEVSDVYHIEFDKPYRELGFHGTPSRGRVFLQPTVNCLVHLIEPPFTVLTLSEVELVHFERVQFGLREFDMVFIFKDYQRPTMHINSIPIESKDPVQQWLNDCNIKYYEGPQNLSWKRIMQEIIKDPQEFLDNGGWNFLDMEGSDNEAGGDDSDEGSDAEGFKPSDDESGSDDGEEDSDEFESGTASEEMSDDASDASEGEESGDETGKTWDELEREAQREDNKRAYESEDDDDRRKKVKTKSKY